MTRLLTPSRCREIYTHIRSLPPFSQWRLPKPTEIEFQVIQDAEIFGDYMPEPHTIRISSTLCTNLQLATETICHEVIHMAMWRSRNQDWAEHNQHFKKRAKQVCEIWGFDLGRF